MRLSYKGFVSEKQGPSITVNISLNTAVSLQLCVEYAPIIIDESQRNYFGELNMLSNKLIISHLLHMP